VSSRLSAIPVDRRRQLAAILGLFAVLLIAIGAVAATDDRSPVIKSFVVIALILGAVVAMFAWGVVLTVRTDLAERSLDAAIEDAVAASGRRPTELFGCGHDHDPDELHFVDGEHSHDAAADCAADGAGATCAHDCATCLLAPASRRPSPTPRPRPR
jgi:hypothetical protein